MCKLLYNVNLSVPDADLLMASGVCIALTHADKGLYICNAIYCTHTYSAYCNSCMYKK